MAAHRVLPRNRPGDRASSRIAIMIAMREEWPGYGNEKGEKRKERGKEKGPAFVSPFPRPVTHDDRAARLSQRKRRYSNSTITSSTARLAPAVATIFFTLPSCSALRTFSIFIASMTASFSPALTS